MKVLLFANTDWYLYNYRLSLAQALRARGDEVVLVSPGGRYVSVLQAQGFRWVELPLERRNINPFKEVPTLIRLHRLYTREKPNVVHHFTIKCVLYGSLIAHLLRVPCVVNSITGLGYVFTEGEGKRRWLRGLTKVLYRLALRNTKIVFQNSDDMAFFLQNRLVRLNQITLIRGSGVDIHRFAPCPWPAGTPAVILPTRLLWDKGIREFVEAAQQLRSLGYKARFILVGESDDQNPAAVPTNQLQVWVQEGVIEWWGWKEEMEEVYAQATIVCMPSYREGLPKSLLEAAACGRPIITTDVPGCREVVRHGENGLLVAARDVSSLVEALKHLLNNPSLCKEMGTRGREIVEKEFSSEIITSQTLALYRACLQQGKVSL